MGFERSQARQARRRLGLVKSKRRRAPELGAISKPIPLEDVDGVSIQVEYKGEGFVKLAQARLQASSLEELKRLAELRKGYSKEILPEIWAKDFSTPEYFAEQTEAARDIVAESVARVHGFEVGGIPSENIIDREQIADFLKSLGVTALV